LRCGQGFTRENIPFLGAWFARRSALNPVPAQAKVLFVKNGEIAAEYARACLERSGLGRKALVLADAREALALLFRESAPVMPLKLAVVSQELAPVAGVEVLRQLRADPVYRRVALAMLAEEPSAQAEQACRELRAGYHVRPKNVREYCALLATLAASA
jgi:CheY-like chemotaxis protein